MVLTDVFIQTSAAGEYVVETCHLHFGKLSFSHNFLHEDHEKHILRLNHDIHQLHAIVEQPENGESRRVK